MTRNLIIDAHADTLLKKFFVTTQADTFFFLGSREQKVDYHVTKELLIKGGINTQIFAIFVPTELEKLGIEITLEIIALAKKMGKEERYLLVKSKTDLQRITNDPESLGMILSLEGALALDRNLKLLPIFYELGVRCIGLTWSRRNLFAEGVMRDVDVEEGEGLSIHGKKLLEEMETLGMVVDVSHLNRKSFADVVKLTNKPFIASHSNSYHLCPINRNLSDDQLMQIASADGVIGVNFCRPFLVTEPEKATIHDVIRHIKHITEIAGVAHVGIGSDFDGIIEGPEGLENAGKMKRIDSLLEKDGFSKNEITKIRGQNFQRVLERVWK